VVTVNFKLSELGRMQLDIAAATTFEEVLEQCALKSGSTVGSVIAVKNGKVFGLQEIVEDGDFIDVYPAISGG
jgi:sulfur carrier protein ThiS